MSTISGWGVCPRTGAWTSADGRGGTHGPAGRAPRGGTAPAVLPGVTRTAYLRDVRLVLALTAIALVPTACFDLKKVAVGDGGPDATGSGGAIGTGGRAGTGGGTG